MEEEIDLRPYLFALLKNAKWIFIATLIVAIVAFLLLSLRPDTYTATAVVLFVKENNIIEFDARIRTLPENQPLSALPELAMGDELLLSLLQQIAIPEIQTLEELKLMLDAQTGSDTNIIRLSVQNQDPTQAAQIANLWADLFVFNVNTIFGVQDERQVSFYEAQLTQAEAVLSSATEELVAFQAINQSNIISNTLSFKLQEQSLILDSQQVTSRIMASAVELRDQMEALPNATASTFADQFTAFTLQFEAFNHRRVFPFVVQLDSTNELIGANRSEQIGFLNRLISSLTQKVASLDAQLEVLEPEILNLQRQLQEATTTNGALFRQHLLAEEAYISLTRKVQEERIAAQDENTGLRLISQAITPEKPESSQRLLLTAVAAFGTALVGIMVVVASVWWRQSNEAISRPANAR